MAGYVTDYARDLIAGGSGTALNLTTATIWWMLMNAQVATRSSTTVAGLTPATYEINGTNYTRGYAGTGRKAIGTRTRSTAANKVGVLVTVSPVWTNLGADCGTIKQVVTWLKVSSDADSYVISYENIADVICNGASWTYQVNSSGLWTLA